MSKLFFGFALADSMFTEDCEIVRQSLGDNAEYVNYLLSNPTDLFCNEVAICLNPSHKATINAMNNRFGIHVEIPETAPKVELVSGDKLIVMGVRGLPRLDATRHEYTQEEVDSANFTFTLYRVK